MKFLLIFIFTVVISAPSVFSQDYARKIDEVVKAVAANNQFSGAILVARKGKIIYKNAVGYANREWKIPNTTTTKFRIGSLTKQFTSMVIMQLVNERKLNLQENITTYLPWYRRETGERVTIHHLLNHSSGIPNYTSLDEFDSRKPYSVKEFSIRLCSGDLEFEPGSRFSYSNSGYFLLGAIIEAVTGKSYENVLRQRILDRLGMKNTGYDTTQSIIPNRAAGYEYAFGKYVNADFIDMVLPYAAGSMYSTVEDMLRWDQALYTEQLLPDSLKKIMFAPLLPFGGGALAYGWFVNDVPLKGNDSLRIYSHTGGIPGFGAIISRAPATGDLIVIMDNHMMVPPMSEAIFAILNGLPYEKPKPSLFEALVQRSGKTSIAQAVAFYNDLPEKEKSKYNYEGVEREINRWGYYLLNTENNVEDAVKVFALNVNAFPKSSNVYDSYGEALMRKGAYDEAILNYKKSIELNERNEHGKMMIAKMQARTDTLKVKVDGHEMIFFRSGSSGPVILLEAGGNSTHNCWDMIVPELAKNAIVIRYDRPGLGMSELCTKARTADRVATEFMEALTKLNINGPYIMGGWSWAGFFIRTFAGKYPDKVKGLVLVDPAHESAYRRMALEYPDEFSTIVNEIKNNDPSAIDEFNAGQASFNQAERSDRMHDTPTIVLIATSEKEWSKKELPLKKIWNMELENWARIRPNTTFEFVDSGHFIAREKPEVVIKAIRELIGR